VKYFVAVGLLFFLVSTTERSVAISPPEDEASLGYNYYDGGGITVHGPTVILKKTLQSDLSIEAGARVDIVSSASIDVVTQASKYSEERQEYVLGLSKTLGETLWTTRYTVSDESDYSSDNLSIALAHDLLDKNVTLSLQVARSWDQVGRNDDPSFGWKDFNRTVYALGLTQSLSPRWLAQFNYELTADDGLINNPYRSVLTLRGGATPENYPDARTGQAWVLRSSYGFPGGENAGIKRTLQMDYRYYQDTFDVRSHTGKILYQHYLGSHWLIGGFYQFHAQEAASFYGDRLPASQTFKARDKELSKFSDHWLGGSLRFEPGSRQWGWVKDPYFKVGISFLFFNYDNFTDPRTGKRFSQDSNVLETSFGFHY